MSNWPLGVQATVYERFGASSGTGGAVVTASGTANTKGAYTQLAAATTIESAGMYVMINEGDPAAISAEYLIDIAIGAAASEQVIVANLPHHLASAAGRHPSSSVFLPIRIPLGSRIAVRVQSTTLSLTIKISMVLVGETFHHPGGWRECVTLGATTADSAGTAIDPGGTANTKGAWVQLSASIGLDAHAIIIGVTRANANRALQDDSWQVDIGVGAAASEVVVVPDLPTAQQSSGDIITPMFSAPMPCYIPAGSRVAVRAQSGIITADDRVFDAMLYLFG